MKNILIIEDEAIGFKKIESYCKKELPDWNIMGPIKSNSSLQEFMKMGIKPDLVFSDIELTDGNVFDSLKQNIIQCPIIFVTAYNSFLIDAFQVNGIGYLLKPYSQEEFQEVVKKYNSMFNFNEQPQLNNSVFKQLDAKMAPNFKERFLVKKGDEIKTIETNHIVCFKSNDNLVFIFDSNNKRHLINNTLKELENILSPKLFLRINRSEIIHIKYIEKVNLSFLGKYKITLKNHTEKLTTSVRKSTIFKSWLDS